MYSVARVWSDWWPRRSASSAWSGANISFALWCGGPAKPTLHGRLGRESPAKCSEDSFEVSEGSADISEEPAKRVEACLLELNTGLGNYV